MEVKLDLSSLSYTQLQSIIGNVAYPEKVREDAAMLTDLKDDGWMPLPDADLSKEWTVVLNP